MLQRSIGAMLSGLKLQALRSMSDEFAQELSKAPYVLRARDSLVATGEARVTLSVSYLDDVRGHDRWDA